MVFIIFVSCTKKKPMQYSDGKDDSLNFYFEESNKDSLPHALRFKYAKRAEEIILKRPNDSMNRVNYFKVANRYWNMGELKRYSKTINDLLVLSENVNDTLDVAKSYRYFGDYYNARLISDSAYISYEKSEKFYLRCKDYSAVSTMLLNKSLIKYKHSDYIGSQKFAFDALRYLKKTNNIKVEYLAYNILGFSSDSHREFNKSLQYHNRALMLAQSMNEKDNEIFISLHNIGLLYQNNNQDEKAIEYFQKALQTDSACINTLRYATLIDNLGYSKLRLKKLDSLPYLFFKAIRISDSLKYKETYSSKLNLARFYLLKNDTTKANIFANQAYLKSVKDKVYKYHLLSLKELININSKKAKQYFIEYVKVSDSLQLAERESFNKFARIEYETEELEIQNKKLESQHSTFIYIVSIIFGLLALVLLLWYQRVKAREFRYVKEQQRTNEEMYGLILDQHQRLEEGKHIEKKRIAKELHDGVMGRLSSIRLNLFVLEKKKDDSTIDKCLNHIREIQEVEKEIKSIAYDLGNNLFSGNISFETIVKNLFTAIENHSAINFTLFTDPNLDWEIVDNTYKIQVYRILQESLLNIDKYAQAKNVSVIMTREESMIAIEIIDDGVGFDKKKIKKGFGLKNMKARAKEIDGTLSIKSEKGLGTKIRLLLPYNHKEQ